MSTLEKNAKLEGDESVFVIGVHPEKYRISVFPGTIENNEFSQSLIKSAVVFAHPENGYVVAKARAGETLAILMVTPYEDGAFLRPSYAACDGSKTLTFKVPAGKVIYISDVYYSYSGRSVLPKFQRNFDAAREYVDSNYEMLKGKLEDWPSELLASNKPCITPITVTIVR